MAVKKNRRGGLGRGLSALIQNTEEQLTEEEIEGPSTVEETSSSPEVEESESSTSVQPRVLEEGSSESAGDSIATEREERGDFHGETDDDASSSSEEFEAPSKPSRDSSAGTDVAHRYMKASTGPAVSPVPRETRRPVDVFFPDRREDGRSASTGTSARNRGRLSIPELSTQVTRSSMAGDALLQGTARRTNQPESVDDDAPLPKNALGGVLPDGSELKSIPVASIHPNPRQPREVFDEDDMDELVASISEVGVLQPVVVRPVQGDSPYELVMGERRWRATQQAGLTEIPAIVRHTSDEDLLRDALLENLHRSQLNPLEEAAAYQQLLDDFNCTQDELSARIGRSRPQISNTLRLMKLPPLVQRRVASGVLSAGHARALLSLADPGEMEKLAQKIVSEGLSVRATEELVALEGGLRQPTSRQRPARNVQHHERLDYWANSLTDSLDTTVKITLGARKGKIAIDFASVEDLHRIMGLIQPTQDPSAE